MPLLIAINFKNMKKQILVLFIILTNLCLLNAQPSIQWQKSFGGSQGDGAYSICQAIDGGYVVAGYTGSNDSDVTVNHGNLDYWILKLNNTGSIEWQKSLGGTDKDFPYSIQQTADGGYIVAGQSISDDIDITGNHGQEDYWIVKLNSTGSIQWQKSLGGSNNDYAYSIIQTMSGGFIVAGTIKSTDGDISFHHGTIAIQYDYWIVNLDSLGTILWEKSLGGSSNDLAQCIIQTADSGFVIAGRSSSIDGEVTAHNGTTQYSDFWIVKLNNSGNIQWQKSLGGTLDDGAYSIQQTLDGGFIVGGNSTSSDGDVSLHYGSFVSNDIWIIKIDSVGNLQWEKTLGGTGTDMLNVIQQTNDGEYILAGYTSSDDGDLAGLRGRGIDYDYWIIKLSNTGNIHWQKLMGGTKDDIAECVKQTNDNGFIISGSSASNNGDLTKNNGKTDFWIVKLSSLVNVNEIPNSLLSFEISPNPFSMKTNISIKKSLTNDVRIEIYSIEGRIINTFNNLKLSYGANQFSWDGTSKDGVKVENGIYFITVFSVNVYETKKVVVLND